MVSTINRFKLVAGNQANSNPLGSGKHGLTVNNMTGPHFYYRQLQPNLWKIQVSRPREQGSLPWTHNSDHWHYKIFDNLNLNGSLSTLPTLIIFSYECAPHSGDSINSLNGRPNMEVIRIGRVGIGLLARLYFEIGEKLGELVCYGASVVGETCGRWRCDSTTPCTYDYERSMSRGRLDPWICRGRVTTSRTISALFAAAARCNRPPHCCCLQVDLIPSRCISLQLVGFPVACALVQIATIEVPNFSS